MSAARKGSQPRRLVPEPANPRSHQDKCVVRSNAYSTTVQTNNQVEGGSALASSLRSLQDNSMDEVARVLKENGIGNVRVARGGNPAKCVQCDEDIVVRNGVTLRFVNKLPVCDKCYSDERAFQQMGFAVIKPHAVEGRHTNEIVNALAGHKLTVTAFQISSLDRAAATELFRNEPRRPSDDELKALTSGRCVVLCIVGVLAVKRLGQVVGDPNPAKAKQASPNSIRAKFGESVALNAIWTPSNEDNTERLLAKFFPGAGVEVEMREEKASLRRGREAKAQ